MSKTPRGKRVPDATGESFVVVNKAPNGKAEPFFDRTREVWIAPWRKPDGKVGRPTGKTRALAVASRNRHVEKAAHEAAFGDLAEGFNAETTVGQLSVWWLEHVARHRVRDVPGDLPKARDRHRRQARFRFGSGAAARAGDDVRIRHDR